MKAGSSFGWERWIGTGGIAIGLERFGASAPAEVLFRELGFTSERIVRAVKSLLGTEALARG